MNLASFTITGAFGCITFITNILFLSTTLFTRVWRTFNGKWKELFHDACVCDRRLYLLCRSESEDGLRDGEMKPIISAKHTPQASRAGELDTIFDIRSFWEINTLMHRVFSLHLLGWM